MTFESCRDRRREGVSVLRQCQYVQLYILHVIDAICKEYNLPYLLEGGTLLGAMRHNGFIPWDDDLDIGMPRRDYNRFLKIAREALPADLMLCLPSDVPRTAIPFAKVRDRNSFYCECRPDIKTSDPSGIYVDIFPYDDLPRVGNWGRKLLVHACASTWARARFFYNRGGCVFPLVVLNAVLGLACQVLHGFFVSLVWLLNKLLPSRYVIACLNEGYDFYYDKALLYPAASHVFEDGEFPVPKESDRILTSQYGDWRQVPPPEQRPRHARIIVPYVK